jgi:hypothetical protein
VVAFVPSNPIKCIIVAPSGGSSLVQAHTTSQGARRMGSRDDDGTRTLVLAQGSARGAVRWARATVRVGDGSPANHLGDEQWRSV